MNKAVIYFGATGKSFRTAKSSETMKYGAKRTGVFLIYRDNIEKKL